MTDYYLNEDDLQVLLALSKLVSNKFQLDSKTKNVLTKSLNKRPRRTPFKQIDINQIKPGMSGAREDDDEYHLTSSDDDEDADKENVNSDNNILQRKRKRHKNQ